MRRLKIGDRLLRVRDEGDSKRAPLVCIHGAGASSVVWMDSVRRLAPLRRIVALDLPGHGQSDRWHPPAEVTVEHYRDAVGTVCATLGITQAVLIGHSLGGQVALACAEAWPDKVAGLVLVASGLELSVPPTVLHAIRTDFAHAHETLGPLLWSPATPVELSERWTGLLSAADAEVTEADFRAAAAFRAPRAVASSSLPSLVIGGEDDLLAPPAVQRELGKFLGTMPVLLPRAAHLPMLEEPAAFFSALESFLTTTR